MKYYGVLIKENLFFIILINLLITTSSLSKDLPPLGKRIYLTDGNIFTAVKIKKIKDLPKNNAEYLLDPASVPEEVIHKFKNVKKHHLPKKKYAYKPKKLKFKSLNIKGKLLIPKIKFSQKKLLIDRVDQKPRLNFLQKTTYFEEF